MLMNAPLTRESYSQAKIHAYISIHKHMAAEESEFTTRKTRISVLEQNHRKQATGRCLRGISSNAISAWPTAPTRAPPPPPPQPHLPVGEGAAPRAPRRGAPQRRGPWRRDPWRARRPGGDGGGAPRRRRAGSGEGPTVATRLPQRCPRPRTRVPRAKPRRGRRWRRAEEQGEVGATVATPPPCPGFWRGQGEPAGRGRRRASGEGGGGRRWGRAYGQGPQGKGSRSPGRHD